jgi:cytochrome c peroxidase
MVGVAAAQPHSGKLGREVSIEKHLQDDEEFDVTLPTLVEYGRKLFTANWTWQEGGGRPLSKGNGFALTDPAQPLAGRRAFNRISGPDANSCAGCHNAPYGIAGGGGDFVTNVFVQAQRFDFATLSTEDRVPTRGRTDEGGAAVSLETVGNLRATTGLFGAGYIEMLAREITSDLQAIRDTLKKGESKQLVSKGIHFGTLSRREDGTWDTSRVQGLSRVSLIAPDPISPPNLVIRPWHQSGSMVSIREFTNNAFNQHHGMQSTERFGRDTDPDGDGVTNELTRADITAITIFQATLQVPGRVIPHDREIEQAVWRGEQLFAKIDCGRCHISALPLSRKYWVFTEPGPYNPPGNLRNGDARTIAVDLQDPRLPRPRLKPSSSEVPALEVPAFTDFKLHDITSGPEDSNTEPLDMNWPSWSPNFRAGNRRFLTRRLWGAANEPPYFHHGRFTTMREAIVAHSGEALVERQSFQALTPDDQDSVIEFLKTLQVLPPGVTDLIVDETYCPRAWPPTRRD